MTDTAAVTVTPSTAPGPGGRMQRSVGQIAGSQLIVELWLAFGWLGADAWTERQVLAVSGVAYFAAAAGHNLWNWYSTRNQPPLPPAAVEIAAVAVDEPPARKRR